MVSVGWLLLLTGVGLVVLGLASAAESTRPTSRLLNYVAAVAGGVVVVLALIRLVD